jgi:hypothetical protein
MKLIMYKIVPHTIRSAAYVLITYVAVNGYTTAKVERARADALIAGYQSATARTQELVSVFKGQPFEAGCPINGEVIGPVLDKNGKPVRDKRGKVKTKVIC